MTMDADAEMKDVPIGRQGSEEGEGEGGGGRGGEVPRDLERCPDDESPSMARDDPQTIVRHFTWDSDNGDSAVDLSADPHPLPVRTLPIVVRWKGEGQTISLSGSYDEWRSKMPLVKSQEDFYTVVEVPEGTHQYKFLVDGEWRCHPNEPMMANNVGSQNNVMTVKASDCDLSQYFSDNSITTSSATGGKFSQYIPPKQASYCFMRSGPPAIPPQLLETILSKEVPAHCEPIMVAEPTHVVLNHLYTLSIKDDVMVMSMTHRYRKKFITTLLYRPIIKG